MQEIGTIIRSLENSIEVQLENNNNCQTCSSKAYCNPDTHGKSIIKIPTRKSYVTGQKVLIEINPYAILVSSILIFIFPLIFLFVGYLIGFLLGLGQNLSILLAFLTLIFSFFLIKIINNKK